MITRDNRNYPNQTQDINFHQDDDRLRFFYEAQAQLLALNAQIGPDLSSYDLEALEEDCK